MHILFVIHAPRDPHTAVYSNCSRHARFLEQHGHEAQILVPADLLPDGYWSGRLTPLVYPFYVAAWLRRNGHRYDACVFHSYAGWVTNLLRPWRRHKRTITAFHGLEPLYYEANKQEAARADEPLSFRFRLFQGWMMPKLIRLSCRRSDLILCLNRREALYLATHKWGDPSHVAVISNGVSPMFFVANEYDPQVKRLIFVGQWLPPKGIRYLAEAFNELCMLHSDLELWCVGTLREGEAVKAIFRPAVRDRVIVRPRVDAEALLALYRQSDLFVFPTLSEGFSAALLEAMAMGLPIVATAVGAAPDILQHDVNALLVPPFDAGGLTRAICRLLADVELRKRLGTRAQSTARTYQWDRVCHEYMLLLARAQRGEPPSLAAVGGDAA